MSGYIKIKVGDYEHSVANRNAAWFTWRENTRLSQAGRRFARSVQVVLTSVVLRDTQEELTTELEALKSAHTDGTDLIVLDNADAETVHVLRNSETINGVRVRVQEYPGGNPGGAGPQMEYVNQRVVRSVFTADFVVPESTIMYYRQSIRLIGTGGASFVIREGFFPPVRQETKPFTKFAVLQEGYAVGLEDYPLFPDPMFPFALRPESFIQEYISPEMLAVYKNLGFGIRWRYYFEAAAALTPIGPPPAFL